MAQGDDQSSQQQMAELAHQVHGHELKLSRELFRTKGGAEMSIRGYDLVDGGIRGVGHLDIDGMPPDMVPQVVQQLLKRFAMVAVTAEGWVTQKPLNEKQAAAQQTSHGHHDAQGRLESLIVALHTKRGMWTAIHPIARCAEEAPMLDWGSLPTLAGRVAPQVLDANLEQPQHASGRMVDPSFEDGDEGVSRAALRALLTNQPAADPKAQALVSGMPWEQCLPLLAARICLELQDVAPVLAESMRGDVLAARKAVCDSAVEFMMTTTSAPAVRLGEDGRAHLRASADGSTSLPAVDPDGRTHEQALLGLTLRVDGLPAGAGAQSLDQVARAVSDALNSRFAQAGLLAAAPVNQRPGEGEIYVVGEFMHPATAQALMRLASTWLVDGQDGEDAVDTRDEVRAVEHNLVERAKTEATMSQVFRDAHGTYLTIPLIAHYVARVSASSARLLDREQPAELLGLVQRIRHELQPALHQAARSLQPSLGVVLEPQGLGPFFAELRRKYRVAHEQTVAMLVMQAARHFLAGGHIQAVSQLHAHLMVERALDGSALEVIHLSLGPESRGAVHPGDFQIRRSPYQNMQDFLQTTVDAMARLGVAGTHVIRRDLGEQLDASSGQGDPGDGPHAAQESGSQSGAPPARSRWLH